LSPLENPKAEKVRKLVMIDMKISTKS